MITRYVKVKNYEGQKYFCLIDKDGELDRGFREETDLNEYIDWLKKVWRDEVKIIDKRD